MPYVRTVKTKSGATAVQVVWSSRRGSRQIEHVGPAHGEAGLEALKAAARQKIAAGQLELDLGPQAAGPGGPLPVTSTRTGHLLDALDRGYRVLGLDEAAGGDKVFRLLVAARVIEPVSKLDSLRVLEEAGIAAPSYPTVKRRLPAYAKEDRRRGCRRRAPGTPGWGRAAWSCTTSALSTSRLTGATGSASPVFEGAAAGAADHHRAAHRPGRVPADAVGV